ncbi:rRNA methyltransferase 2, mitochondrial-like [Tubulanus polymorphus]|uniref:rRNA methyltransferase 2, mitochondrial-like n=1 Tax=Tubulanus polymorphus TaxID=672921 RepID=UPI003DA4BAAF
MLVILYIVYHSAMRIMSLLSSFQQTAKLSKLSGVGTSLVIIRSSIASRNGFSTTSMNSKAHSKSSNIWLARQNKDPYVKKARYENYRCRSAFKLLEINERFRVLKPGDVVVDCGAAPGSWSQVAAECVNAAGVEKRGSKGTVISVDIQSFIPVKNCITLQQSDFTLPETRDKISQLLQGKKVDVIVSDMAPKATGIKKMDHFQIVELCRIGLKFATQVLNDGGTFVCKLWQGEDEQTLKRELREYFDKVKPVKPNASRGDSAEMFFLCTGFKT